MGMFGGSDTFDNTGTGLTSTTKQAAIAELAAEQAAIAADIAAGLLFGPVNLTADISGVLPLANGGCSVVALPSSVTGFGTSYSDVTGLTFAVVANATYHFEFYMEATADAATTGYDFAVNGPASPTSIIYVQEFYSGDNFPIRRMATAYDTDSSSGSSQTAGGNRVSKVAGILQTGATAGSLTVRGKHESTAGGSLTVSAGFGILRRVA